MNDLWAKVIVGVTVAVLLAILTWLSRPIRARLDTSRRRVLVDHGLKATMVRDASALTHLPNEWLLGLQPEWLEDQTFYFPRGLPSLDPPGHDLQRWAAWGREQGGQDVYFTHALVMIQATHDRTIVLQPPLVHRVRTPVREGAIGGPSGLGGNGLLVRRFYVNLDSEDPEVKYIDGEEKEAGLFQMKKGDTEVFLLVAEAPRDHHEWTISIPAIIDGTAVELSVKGRPLVTVGPEGVPRFSWVQGRGWVPS